MDHEVIQRFRSPEMCGGCAYCSDVNYLSEDSEDSYFLHEPHNFDIRSSDCLLEDWDLYNLYEPYRSGFMGYQSDDEF